MTPILQGISPPIQTAKANNFDPYEYLKYWIDNIATANTVEAYEAPMPWIIK